MLNVFGFGVLTGSVCWVDFGRCGWVGRLLGFLVLGLRVCVLVVYVVFFGFVWC